LLLLLLRLLLLLVVLSNAVCKAKYVRDMGPSQDCYSRDLLPSQAPGNISEENTGKEGVHRAM
jgi:hypothetical protein